MILFFFFFNDTATTEIYTLSLHDALPILIKMVLEMQEKQEITSTGATDEEIAWMEEEHMQNEAYMEQHGRIDYGYGMGCWGDRKSTRLNSSHANISYAVFCLKKKKKKKHI